MFDRRRGKRVAAPPDLVNSILPFVARPDVLPPVVAAGAPEVVPGLASAVAVFQGSQLDFVPPQSFGQLGGLDNVAAVARRNLRRRAAPEVEVTYAVDGDPTSAFHRLITPVPFCAALLTDHDHLLRVAGRLRAPHGFVVSAPHCRMVFVHPLRGRASLAAIEKIAVLTAHFTGRPSVPAPERLLPDVFVVAPDGRSEAVAYPNPAGGITVNVRGLAAEVFFGPRGLLENQGR